MGSGDSRAKDVCEGEAGDDAALAFVDLCACGQPTREEEGANGFHNVEC